MGIENEAKSCSKNVLIDVWESAKIRKVQVVAKEAEILGFELKNGQKNGGSPGGNRTHDQLLRRQLLYPLSYRAE